MSFIRNAKKTVSALAVSALVLSSALVIGASSAQAIQGAQLSTVGEKAFGDITTCLTSGKNPQLDVYYLVDNSGSLSYTDKSNVRQKVLESSVSELESFASQGIKVGFAASLFASHVEPVQSWSTLSTSSDFKRAVSLMHNAVSNDNLGGYTDWEGGFKAASKAFSERPASSCKMLVWLTDGGINPTGDPSDIIKSLNRLCHQGITDETLGDGNTRYGIIANLRKQGISVFGILYQNDKSSLATYKAHYSGNASDLTPEENLEVDHYLMSFMTPLVEGSGTIPDSAAAYSYGLPRGGPLTCAPVDDQGFAPLDQPNGAFLNAQDPVGLSFQFLKLQSVISGGSGSPIVGGKFTVPSGTSSFRILTTSTKFKLTGPAGSSVSLSQSSPSKTDNAIITNMAGVNVIDFQVDDLESLLGQWSFEQNGNQSELFLYSGLTISLDRDKYSQIVADRSNTLTGQVVRTDLVNKTNIDLSRFSTHALTLAAENADGKIETVPDLKISLADTGEFKIENYVPKALNGQDHVSLWLTLNLGDQFQEVKSQFDMSIVDATALPVPSSDVVMMSPLDGPKGSAEGTITVKGPSVATSSTFCLSGTPSRTTDVQTASEKHDRMAGFAWAFDGNTSAEDYCVDIAQGETKVIKVTATNPTQADGHVVSIRGYSSTAGAAKLEQTMRFEFDSHATVNEWAKWAAIALLLLLGILGPLLVLYFFNKASTKFLPTSGVVAASYDVTLQPGPITRIVDARPATAGNAITVVANDFKPIAASEKGQASLPLGAVGTASARAPFWPPLTSPWFELAAPAGYRVLSIHRGAIKNPSQFESGLVQEVSPNISDIWALLISEGELLKPKTEPVKATLAVYAPMGQLASYQTKIGRISAEGSLGAKLDAMRASLQNQKPEKPQKQKKFKFKGDEGSIGGNKGNQPPTPPTNGPTPPPPPGGGSTGPAGIRPPGLTPPPGSGASAGGGITPPPSSVRPPGMTPPPGVTPPPGTSSNGGGITPPPSSK